MPAMEPSGTGGPSGDGTVLSQEKLAELPTASETNADANAANTDADAPGKGAAINGNGEPASFDGKNDVDATDTIDVTTTTSRWKVVVKDSRDESHDADGSSGATTPVAHTPSKEPGLPFPTNFNIPTEDDDPGGEWIDRTNTPLGAIGVGYELTPRLQTLCLTNNRIKKIENLEKCPKLRELILRQNAITTIEGLDVLSELEDLDLYMNAVEQIPAGSFASNPKLRRVDLSFNQLRTLDGFPSENLANVKELFLIGNKIRKITGLSGFTQLVMLELGDNRIREIENLDELTTLEGLWLGRNKISHIENLDMLVNLRRLSLQSNRITEIEGLGMLHQLEELYLSHNGLRSMSGLETLVNLRVLDLGSNEIEHIESIEMLSQLTEFWFNGNKLESFEELEMLQCHKDLETVYLEGNPLARDNDYQRKVLDILPDSLQQLDALLVCDVRRKLEAKAVETGESGG